jgi:hypothetical protein
MNRLKNKEKYDIAVVIPTYNEMSCIGNTVKKIDEGLARYYPDYRPLIINADSDSGDGTKEIFISTKSKSKKIFISGGKNPRGKGKNIFSAIKLSLKLGVRYIAMFDADISTIGEKWVKLMIDPVINDRADFVTPIYTRNRYEGNTTNHFCYPLLYAWFGKSLAQPIGGDFSMSRKFANHIINKKKPPSAYIYGVDVFLSIHAVGDGFKLREIYLGRKIHKPSFEKMIPMFQQVAATLLYLLPGKRRHQKCITTAKRIGRIDKFIKKPEESKIIFLKKYALKKLKKTPLEEIKKIFGINDKKIIYLLEKKPYLSEDEWIKILANLIKYIDSNEIDYKNAKKIASLISPFFFLRVISYFKEVGKNQKYGSSIDIAHRQAKKLKNQQSLSN